MSSPIIDTAAVRIVPDFSGFNQALEGEIVEPLESIDAQTEAIIKVLEGQFAEMAAEIGSIFDEIRDDAALSLDSIAVTGETVNATIEAEFAEMAGVVDGIFDEIRIAADTNLDAVGAKSVETSGVIKGAFGAAAGAVSLGATAIAAGLGATALFGLKSAASLEQVNVALDSLTGSVAAGTKQFQQLQAFANTSPFEFNDLTTSAEKFDAFSAAIGQTKDDLTGYLTTVGNLVAETGGGAQALDSISLAFGQTASQGKLTLGNLEQINNAIPGFNAVAAIAAQRGITQAQALQQISAGTIDAKSGLNDLLKGMQQFPGAANAMAKQATTLLGVFSTFHDVISQSLANAFTPVIPAIKASLAQLTPVIGDAIGTLAPALGTLIAQILPILGDLVKALVPIITPILKALGDAAVTLGPTLVPLGDALGKILVAVQPLIPALAGLTAKLLMELVPVLITLTPLIADMANILIGLTNFIEAHQTVFESLALAFLGIVAAIKLYNIIMGIAAIVTDGLTVAFGIFDALLAASGIGLIIIGVIALAAGIAILATKTNFFQDAWRDIWDFLKTVGKWFAGPFVDFFVNAYNSVIKFFVALPGEILDAFKALPGLLEALIEGMFNAIFFIIGFEIGLIIRELMDFPNQVIAIFKLLWDLVIALFTKVIPTVIGWYVYLQTESYKIFVKMMDDIRDVIFAGINAVVGFFEALPGRALKFINALPGALQKAASAAGSWLKSAGANVINGFIQGIKDQVGDAIKAVESAFHSITNGAKAALGINSPSKVFMEIGQSIVEGTTLGVTKDTPDAHAAIAGMLLPKSSASSTSGGSAGVTISAGAIVVNVNGSITAEQAYQVGGAIGQGISDQLATRDIRQQVRTM